MCKCFNGNKNNFIVIVIVMYQVLQVYTSFSFFDNFLSRSIKVGQSSSRRRRREVAETSPRSCGDVAAKLRRRRGDVVLLENI